MKSAVAILLLTVRAAADPGSGAAGGDWAFWCALRIDQARAQLAEGEPRLHDARVIVPDDRSTVGLDDGQVWIIDRTGAREGIQHRSWFGDPDSIGLAKNGRSALVHSSSVEPERVKRFMEKMRVTVDACLSDPVDSTRRYTADGKLLARSCPWKPKPFHAHVRIAFDENWLVADTGWRGQDRLHHPQGKLVFQAEEDEAYGYDVDRWTLRREPNGVLTGELRRIHMTHALDRPCEERLEVRLTPYPQR